MSTESSPLLSYRLFSVVDDGEMPGSRAQEEAPLVGGDVGGTAGPPHPDPARRLSTFFGVVVPTVLSMFSIVVFMRVGFVVGHAGFLQSLLMLVVAYVIILLTVLSVCAICTNGAIQGGGAYCILQPMGIGGYRGQVRGVGRAAYGGEMGHGRLSLGRQGLWGAVVGVPPADGTDPPGARALPQGYFYSFLYGSAVLLLCLLVCLVGARIYARAAFLIFLVVNLVLVAIFVSFVAVGPRQVSVARDANHTFNASFTGFRLATLRANLPAMYSRDYTTNNVMTFATVFAVMFNGCTGIMAGSNMSGELRNASSSIPRGTIIAVVYTFIIYFLLFLMTSFTCERTLLKEDYGFFRSINLWPPLVLVGVYAASLSASMSSLIGASRILHALAKDDLFGIILAPAKIVSKGGNPWVAVLYTWALVQVSVPPPTCGMKPNTLVLGFYDACVPDDYFLRDPAFSQARENDHFGVDLPALQAHFPAVRGAGVPKALLAAEYVSILSDAVKMHKNVCLARYFPLLDKERLFSSKAEGCFVDVWPLNLLRPDTPAYVDVCSLFLLQLACILTMVSSWRAACLRLFLCVESGDRGWVAKEEKLKELLTKLRIKATIRAVTWDHVVALHGQRPAAGEPFLNPAAHRVTDEYLAAVNALVLQQGGQVAVRFLYLPRPPADTSMYERYLEQLEILTRDLGPTLLVHGLTPVTCTEL
nr:solute carrier family 12 member 9-like [Chrysemys picta bellii]